MCRNTGTSIIISGKIEAYNTMSFEQPHTEEELTGESLELYQSIIDEVTKNIIGKEITLTEHITGKENQVRVTALSEDPSFVYIHAPDSSHSELTSLHSVINSREVTVMIEGLLKKAEQPTPVKEIVRKKLFPYLRYAHR